MTAAALGFAVFLLFAFLVSMLLLRLVIRGVRDRHSTSSGFSDGWWFVSDFGSGGDGSGGDCGGGDGGCRGGD